MEKITFMTDDNTEEVFFIIDETRVNGTNYLLVTDTQDEEDEEAVAYILKDTSSETDTEAVYEFVEDDAELESVGKIFEAMLEDVDID